MSKSLKNIGVLSFLTVVSRVLALVRDSLSLAIFGAGLIMSAFNTAFILPNLFRRLLAEGSMTAAFVPTLQEELHANGRAGTFGLLSKVASWLLVVTGSLSLVAMAVFSHSRIIPGHEDKWYIAADLTVILFPYLALISLAAAFSAALNVLEHFCRARALADLAQPGDDRDPGRRGPPLREFADRRDPLALRRRAGGRVPPDGGARGGPGLHGVEAAV